MSNIFQVGKSTPKYPDLVDLKPIETSQTELQEKIQTILNLLGTDPGQNPPNQKVFKYLYDTWNMLTDVHYMMLQELYPEINGKLDAIISAINSGGTGGGVSPDLQQSIADVLGAVQYVQEQLTGEYNSLITQIYEAVQSGGGSSSGGNVYPSMQDYAIMQRFEIPSSLATFPTYIPLIVSQTTYRYYFDNIGWSSFKYQYVSRDTGATDWFDVDGAYFNFDTNRGHQVNFCIKMYDNDAYFYFTTYLQHPLPFVYPTIGQYASMQEMSVPAPLRDFPCALVNEGSNVTIYYKTPIDRFNMRYAAMDDSGLFEWKTPDVGNYFVFDSSKRFYYMAYTDPATSKVFYFTVYFYAYR